MTVILAIAIFLCSMISTIVSFAYIRGRLPDLNESIALFFCLGLPLAILNMTMAGIPAGAIIVGLQAVGVSLSAMLFRNVSLETNRNIVVSIGSLFGAFAASVII